MLTDITGTEKAMFRRAATQMSPDDLYDGLAQIFTGADSVKVKSFREKIVSSIDNAEKDDAFIEKYARGDIDKLIPVGPYMEDNGISADDKQRKELFSLIHQYIIGQLHITKCFKYIENTFPLWSKLKRLLLQTRRGTDMKQWEYAASLYKWSTKKDEAAEHFQNAANYKQLNNYIVADAVSVLVDSAIENAQFKKTITQESKGKGWFPYGLDYPPRQHIVEKKTLFKLAYGFGLSSRQMDEFCEGSEKGARNPFDFEENMFRFGLEYGIPFRDILKVVKETKAAERETTYTCEQACAMIDDFFDKNSSDGSTQKLMDSYISLLREIGSCDIDSHRKACAREALSGLLEKVSVNKIKEYYAYNITSMDDLISERYYYEETRYNQSEAMESTRFSIDELGPKEKEKAICCICDGKNVALRDLSSKAFTRERVNHILKGDIDEINRDDILRTGYLYALVRFINGEISENEIVGAFEEQTNPMLKDCMFHKLHMTFPLDALMYLSLLSTNRCIPEVFQVFLPVRNKKE
ncbi:MAG: hypothetical protein Q4A05_00835, partial [Ruminococcus sp.]|nr:hypothetical protein [Ruminococcus sp.]